MKIKTHVTFRKTLLTLCILLLHFNFVFAQQLKIKGIVKGNTDELPIPGVSVVIKGSSVGTITDMEGRYSIKAEKGKVLIFSFIGMKTQEIVVSKPKQNVVLKEDLVNIEEVVAIGYGTQKKKEISGAVVQIKSDELQKNSTSDLGMALQGKIAGVSIQASSGEPGSNSNIQIRGVSSITGSNSPLFVVDGIPQEEDPRLSSSEIASIDVLKDAASASIYGTRGAGGVILITTKQGKSGQMQISYDGYGGIQKITSGMDLMNFEEFMYQDFVAKKHSIPTSFPSEEWTTLWTSPNGFTRNTNMIDIMENDNAMVQNHSLNISGGKKDLTYSVVASYYDQEGVIVNSDFQRFSLRANSSFQKDKWTIRTGLGMKMEDRTYAPSNFLYQAYKYKPYQAAIDPDAETIVASGPATSNDAQNKGTLAAKFKQRDIKEGDKFNGNLDIKYELFKGFNLTTQFGFSRDNSLRTLVKPSFEVFDEDGTAVVNVNTRSSVRNTLERKTSTTWESGFNYAKKIANHQFKLLGIFSTEKYTKTKFYAEGKDIFDNSTPVLEETTSEPAIGSGTDYTRTMVGMLARFQYSYEGKYNLSMSARRDGSSQFAQDNRWGIFPSASLSWNVSDEAFWEPLVSTVNSLKIRSSYGTTGNQNFDPYSYAANIESGYDYPFGEEENSIIEVGASQSDFANATVKWETTIQRNIGIDLGLFNNQFTITADYYDTDKNEMLFPLLLPSSAGVGKNETVILNVGDMNNKGVELCVGYRNSAKFSWGVNTTFTKNVNKVTKMSDSGDISYFKQGNANGDQVTAIKTGYEAGSFFVIETDGIVNTEEKLLEYQKIEPSAEMGDLIYVDQDGNNDIDNADRVYGGCGAPEWEMGLSFSCDYKGVDFSMNWFASYGNEIINVSRIYAFTANTHKDLIYQWSEANPNAVIPANRGSKHSNYRGWSDFWIEDGSYLRLRNIILGYSIPNRLISKMGISKLRGYIAADNPLTITNYSGYDPEVGNDGLATRGLDLGNYPISSQYRIGIQLNF